MVSSDIQDGLIGRIRLVDRAGALALLDGWAAEHGLEQVLEQVVDPLLARMGERWQGPDGFSVAQMFVAAKVTEDVLGRIASARRSAAAPVPSRGTVVIGNIEEDFHALGRRMLGTFLRADGWEVHDLGCDVPAGEFVDGAVRTGAAVIGVSAMTMGSARLIGGVRAELDRRGLGGRVALAVGGAVFRVCPGLVDEVGGDGTAASALGASELCARLQRRIPAAAAP